MDLSVASRGLLSCWNTPRHDGHLHQTPVLIKKRALIDKVSLRRDEEQVKGVAAELLRRNAGFDVNDVWHHKVEGDRVTEFSVLTNEIRQSRPGF